MFYFGRNVHATIEVIGLESTLCHTVAVSGGVNQTLFEAIGGGEDCQQPTGPVVIGPVPRDGERPQVGFLFFSIGSYWTNTSRLSERVWEVRFEDWQDYDFNDVVIRITFADVPQETIRLSCSPDTLVRGETTTCTASKVPNAPAGELTITEWSFDGKVRTGTGATSTEWKGPMVRSGTVQVKARVGTAPEQPLTAPITVVPRDPWQITPPAITIERVRPEQLTEVVLPEMPVFVQDLIRDQRLVAKATELVRDKSRPELVRVGAMLLLMRYATPGISYDFRGLVPPDSAGPLRILSGITSSDGRGTIEGAEPLPRTGYPSSLLALLREVADHEQERTVQYAAARLALTLELDIRRGWAEQ